MAFGALRNLIRPFSRTLTSRISAVSTTPFPVVFPSPGFVYGGFIVLAWRSILGMNLPPYSGRPDQFDRVLKARYHDAMTKLHGKELDLLIVVLPENNGSLFDGAIHTLPACPML